MKAAEWSYEHEQGSLAHTWISVDELAALRAERDAATAQLAVARELLLDAERAQMERDCVAVCSGCALHAATGDKDISAAYLSVENGHWEHAWNDREPDAIVDCVAEKLRRAFAALHREPSHA